MNTRVSLADPQGERGTSLNRSISLKMMNGFL
jgi:hypothetical protein